MKKLVRSVTPLSDYNLLDYSHSPESVSLHGSQIVQQNSWWINPLNPLFSGMGADFNYLYSSSSPPTPINISGNNISGISNTSPPANPYTQALSGASTGASSSNATSNASAVNHQASGTSGASGISATASSQSLAVALDAANPAPVTHIPGTVLRITEDAAVKTIHGISVSVADANTEIMVRLELAHGTLGVSTTLSSRLTAAGITGLTNAGITGQGTGTLTLTGTASAINATLTTLSYTVTPNFSGSDTLTVSSSVGGSPALSSSGTMSIDVAAVNDVPTIAGIPDSASLIFVNVAADLVNLSVNDADGPNTTLYVTLVPTSGGIGGFTAGNANGLLTQQDGGTIQLTGTAAAINAALAAATFTANVAGTASIEVRVSDLSLADTSPATSSTRSYSFSADLVPLLGISNGQDNFINAAESSVNVELTFDSLAQDDTVQISVDGTQLPTLYTATASDASNRKITINIAKADLGGGDGLKTITAKLTQNGTSTTSAPLVLTLDTAAPAAPMLAVGAGVSGTASAAEATAAEGVVSVNAGSGSIVRVTFTDSTPVNPVSLVKTLISTGAALAATLSSEDLGTGAAQLRDGAIRVTATATDLAGNTSMVSNTSSFTLDALAPTVTSIALGAKSVVRDTLKAGDTVDIAVTFSEAVTITGTPLLALDIGGGTGNASYLSADARNTGASTTKHFRYTVAAGDNDANGISIAANALSLNSGANLATITDAAGNPATITHSTTVADSITYKIDTAAPDAPTLALGAGVLGGATAAEATAAAGVVTISAESGSTVRVTFTDGNPTSTDVVKTVTGTGLAQAVTLASSDLGNGATKLLDGTITVTATATDLAGNASVAGSSSFTLDTTIATPTLAPGAGISGGATAAEATQSSGAVTVTAESGSTVLVTFSDSKPTSTVVVKTVTGTGLAQAVTLDGTDLGNGASQLAEGTIRVTATATDLAGNTSTAGSSSFTLDTVAPGAPTLALVSGIADGANAAEVTAASGVVTVNAESGSTVRVTFADSDAATTDVIKTVTGTGAAMAVALASSDFGNGATQLRDGSVTVTATATDLAGNPSTVSNTSSFTLEATPPAQPTLLLGTGVAGGATAAEATASTGVVTVTAESGSTVRVTFTDSNPASTDVVKTVTGTGLAQAVTLDGTDLGSGAAKLLDGTITVSAIATDAAGNASQAGANSFTLDSVAPVVSTSLSIVENASTIGRLLTTITNEPVTWAIEGNGADNSLFSLNVPVVNGTFLRWLSDSGRDFEAATKSAAGTNTYTLTVTATDAAGNKSNPQTITITLQDANEAPVNTVPATTAQTPLSTTEDINLAFTGSNLISVSDVDAGSNGIAFVRLSVQNGTILVTANAANAANGGLAADSILNNGTALVTLTGNAAAINATLATLIYLPNANYNGTDTLTVFTSDGAANPLPLTATSTVAISVTAVNDLPTISGVPASAANVTTGTATALSNFSVADVDSSTLYLTLTPSNGSINGLSAGTDAESGLITAIDNNTGRISLTGTAAAINAKLALIRFTATANGAASIAVDVSDVALGDTSSRAIATYSLDAGSGAVPELGIASGQDAVLNSGESTLTVELAMDGLALNDTVQLKLPGSNLGSPYTLTANNFSAGKASLQIAKSSLGSDGSKAITAVVTHGVAASPASNAINLTLDTTLPSVSLSLGNGVANGATAAEATASTGVVSVTAESGSLVTLSFTNQDNTLITRLITGTGAAQAITLTAAEIGAYANQLHDGTITVNAVAVDRAGNVNTAVSSFVLDTVAPQANLFLTSTNWAWIGDVSVINGTPGAGNFYDLATFSSNAGWVSFNAEAGSTLTATYYINLVNALTNNPFLSRDYPAVGGAQLQPIILTSADLAPYLPLATSTNPLRMKFVLKDMAGNSTEISIGAATIQTPPAAPTLTLGAGISNTNGATATEASNGAFSTVTTDAVLVTTFTDDFGRSYVPAVYSGAGAGEPKSFGLPADQLQDGTITATVYSATFYNSISAPASISFVYDTTAPKLAAATIAANRGSIVLTFTEAIDSSALTLAAANSLLVFKTSTSGVNAINSPYSAISVSGNTVTLTLTTPLTALETATVQYTAAAGDQTSAVVQDTAGNDMATLASAFSLSAVPVVSGFVVSDSGNSNGTNRGKASEAVTVQVNFSEAVTLSASTTYTARVQIGSNSANYIDATLATSAGTQTATNSYSFSGTLPATTGLASNALTLISLSGSGITGSNSRALTQTSYSTLSSNSYLVDSDAPTLTISSAIAGQTLNKTNLGAGNTATITFNFTEDPGSSFTWNGSSGDITVTGGTLSALWGAGQKRYATFVPTPNSSGTASISVAAGSYTDAAGNTGAGTASPTTISYDTQPPVTPIIKLGSGVLGGATPAEMAQASGVVTVEAELGQAVTVSFVTTGSSTISKNITGQGKGVAVPVTLSQTEVNSLGITQLNTINVSATATDGASNQSKSTTSFSYYRTPPAPVAYVFRDSGLNFDDGITNDSFVEVDAISVPAGAVAVYTTDAGATWTPVTGGGFYLTKNTTFVANTVGVKNIDAAGNSQIPTYIYFNNANYSTITIDTIAPDAPGVTLLDGLGNSANGATAQITAESGSRVVVTFSDGTRSIPKTVNGLGSGTTVNATLAAGDFGPGAEQLRDGPITVTAVATDLAGNVGAANTSQFVRNSSTPGLSVKSGQDAFVNSTESGVDVYVYAAALASGDTLQLQLGGNNLGSAYSVTASDVTAGRVALTINKAALTGGDGQKSITAVLTHNGTSTNSATPLLLTLDTGVPLAPTLQLDGSLLNGASLVEAIASTGVVFVNAESAASVAVTFTDSANRRIVKKVSGQGINTPVAVALLADDIGSRADQLHDGTITINAIATDAAGNASPIGTSSFALYGTAPAAPALALGTGVEGGATQAEAVAATGVLRISGQSGTTAWLTFSDGVRTLNKTQLLTGGSDAVLLAATEIGNGVAQLHDGTITVSGVQVDVAGNVSPVANARFVLDTVAPTLDLNSGTAGTSTSTTITAANASSFSSNTAILPNVDAVTDADVRQITLDFVESGNVLKAGDNLKVGSISGAAHALDLNSASNVSSTSVSFSAVTGLVNYTYNATSHLLTLSKQDGTAFTGSTIASLLGELQFRNSSATAGTRDFAVHLIDIAGNDMFASGSVVI